MAKCEARHWIFGGREKRFADEIGRIHIPRMLKNYFMYNSRVNVVPRCLCLYPFMMKKEGMKDLHTLMTYARLMRFH